MSFNLNLPTSHECWLGSIQEPAFARAFFGIWLDARTSAPELRAALLQNLVR